MSHFGHVFTGIEFNELHKNKSFWKITNKSEKHNGFEFSSGLNVDKKPFISWGRKKPDATGGIYFYEFSHIVNWVGNSMLSIIGSSTDIDSLRGEYIRQVIIPDDTEVYVEDKKFKANKIVLLDRENIWLDNKICTMMVRNNGLSLKYVKCKTDKICMYAVSVCPSALKYVDTKFQTEHICLYAIKKNIDTFQYIHPSKQTELLCKTAVTIRPEKTFSKISNQTEELCLIAIKKFPDVIKLVVNQTDMICETMLKIKGENLQFVNKQTENLCLTAVKQNGFALLYVDFMFKTDLICSEAIKNNGLALEFVPTKTTELCALAISKNPLSLKFVGVEHQTYELCYTAVTLNPFVIQYVIDQERNLCRLAIYNDHSTMKYIRNPSPDLINFYNDITHYK